MIASIVTDFAVMAAIVALCVTMVIIVRMALDHDRRVRQLRHDHEYQMRMLGNEHELAVAAARPEPVPQVVPVPVVTRHEVRIDITAVGDRVRSYVSVPDLILRVPADVPLEIAVQIALDAIERRIR